MILLERPISHRWSKLREAMRKGDLPSTWRFTYQGADLKVSVPDCKPQPAEENSRKRGLGSQGPFTPERRYSMVVADDGLIEWLCRRRSYPPSNREPWWKLSLELDPTVQRDGRQKAQWWGSPS
jgi:hypothetical protein